MGSSHTITVELGTNEAATLCYMVVERTNGRLVKVCHSIPCGNTSHMKVWALAWDTAQAYGAEFDPLGKKRRTA